MRRFLSLVFLAVTLLSCSDRPEPGGTVDAGVDSASLLPWPSIGTVWTYDVSTIWLDEDECTEELVGEEQHGGEDYLRVERRVCDFGTYHGVWLYRIGVGGLYLFDEDAGVERLLFKYPVSAGATYEYGDVEMEVTSTTTPCDVGEVEYTCIEYEYEDDDDEWHIWKVAPGLGVVQYVHVNFDGEAKSNRLIAIELPE